MSCLESNVDPGVDSYQIAGSIGSSVVESEADDKAPNCREEPLEAA